MPAGNTVEFSDLSTLIIGLIALFAGTYIRQAVPFLKRIDMPNAVIGAMIVALIVLARPGRVRNRGRLRHDAARHPAAGLLHHDRTVGEVEGAAGRRLAAGHRLRRHRGAAGRPEHDRHRDRAWPGVRTPSTGCLPAACPLSADRGRPLPGRRRPRPPDCRMPRWSGLARRRLRSSPARWSRAHHRLADRPARAASGCGRRDRCALRRAAGRSRRHRPTADHGSLESILSTVLMVAISVFLGDQLNAWAKDAGLLLPGFLSAMLAGIVLTNLADWFRSDLEFEPIQKGGEVALQPVPGAQPHGHEARRHRRDPRAARRQRGAADRR